MQTWQEVRASREAEVEVKYILLGACDQCEQIVQQRFKRSMKREKWSHRYGADMGAGPAALPAGLSCRAPPKSQSGSLYAAEPKRWFTDTGCNVRFISVEAIIARVVWEACGALTPNIRRTAFRKN